MALLGMTLCGISVGFFRRAQFGVDPFQCFCGGAANVITLDFGTLYVLINLVLLAVDFFLDRHYIGISTFINLFLLGYLIAFSESTLSRFFGDLTLPGRVLFLLIGIVLNCLAAALYYTADLGVSTYDAIPLHLADRKPKVFGRTVPFRAVRIFCDLICVLIGSILGLLPGIGTLICALCMGPLITLFRQKISEPLLKRGMKTPGNRVPTAGKGK